MNLQEAQTASELANLLYDFLPANPHPYADPTISFPGCATKVGLKNYWQGGSKRPALTKLLQNTLEYSRSHFCPLILEIVKTSIIYKNNKNDAITREDIEELNRKIIDVGFKIPELWDISFLEKLPRRSLSTTSINNPVLPKLDNLLSDYILLSNLDPHPRGFAFQDFLNSFFNAFNVAPRTAFRLKGEEIDGSFELDSVTYLLEAKWHGKQIGQSDLLIFNSKVEGKSSWARGVFISYTGFTPDGLDAFTRGRRTSIIGFDAIDLLFILQGKIGLKEALLRKARRSAETNEFFVSLNELI